MTPAILYPFAACAIGGLAVAGVLASPFIRAAIFSARMEREGGGLQ